MQKIIDLLSATSISGPIRRPFDRVLVGFLDTEGCPHIRSPLRQIFALMTHVQVIQEKQLLSYKACGPHYLSWIASDRAAANDERTKKSVQKTVNDFILPNLMEETDTDIILFIAWNAPHDRAVFLKSNLKPPKNKEMYFVDALKTIRRDCKSNPTFKAKVKPELGLSLSQLGERLGIFAAARNSKLHEAVNDTLLLKAVVEELYGPSFLKRMTIHDNVTSQRVF